MTGDSGAFAGFCRRKVAYLDWHDDHFCAGRRHWTLDLGPNFWDTKMSREVAQCRRIHDHLVALMAANAAAGEEMHVVIQDEPGVRRKLCEVTLDEQGEYGSVRIRYGSGKRGGFGLALSGEDLSTIRLTTKGLSGLDEDGESVEIFGSVGAQTSAPNAPPRSIKKSQAASANIENGATFSPAVGTAACLPPALARALVFRCDQLEKRVDSSGGWQLTVGEITLSSSQPKLWQDHRCVLEYLIAEASKVGSLQLKVPAQKVLNAMDMRYTKNFVPFGIAAMERLRSTEVSVRAGGVETSVRFVEEFKWGSDGAVTVTLRPEAIANFPKANSKLLTEALSKPDRRYWGSWLAGFVANGEAAKISREHLEVLAVASNCDEPDETAKVWALLFGMPAAAGMFNPWAALWYDVGYYKSAMRVDMVSGPMASFKPKIEARSTEELVADLEAHKQRIKNLIAAGGFVANKEQEVAWRIADNSVEFVPFEQSGLQKRPDDDDNRSIWR